MKIILHLLWTTNRCFCHHKFQLPLVPAGVQADIAAATLLPMPTLQEVLHFHSTVKLHGQDLSFLCTFSLPITSHTPAISCHVLNCIDLYIIWSSRAHPGRNYNEISSKSYFFYTFPKKLCTPWNSLFKRLFPSHFVIHINRTSLTWP